MKRLLLMLLFFVPLLALADEKSDLLTITDVFNLETATDPQISPEGEQIVYVCQFADVMTDKYYSNLWIVNFNGSRHRPLTTGHYAIPRRAGRWTAVASLLFPTVRAVPRSTCDGWTLDKFPSLPTCSRRRAASRGRQMGSRSLFLPSFPAKVRI